MENLSFALDEERSTYTEGESKSRRSSILKPRKARAPLQEVNLGGSADDTEDFDTLRKRRVSFAGVNSVKEFCSQAESLQVCHIQSYEETFSTSSDASHNSSAAKSVQLIIPKNAVPSGGDHNFADDPMDLTDSIIESNHVHNKCAPLPVQVIPVFTLSAQLTESVMSSKTNFPVSKPQTPIYDSNMSFSSVVGASAQRPNSAGPPFPLSSPWSCSMEMTEPVQIPQSRMSRSLFPSSRNSFKLPGQSDSGMEITEVVPVKVKPFSIKVNNDDFGDTSMEMTEVVRKGDVKSFPPRLSFPNKSASMDFTEVVQDPRNNRPFQNVQPSSIENTTGNCGMDFTEPVNGRLQSNPSEGLPPAGPSVFPENSAPSQIRLVTPFPGDNLGFNSSEHGGEKGMMNTSGNQSLSDMEMTGVLSLSRYNKLVSNEDCVEDMDFTQLLPVNVSKKARLSNEPDEEPFHTISPLSTKVTEAQQPFNQIKPSTLSSIPTSIANKEVSSGRSDPFLTNEDKSVALNAFDDDDDTLALNFKNIKRDKGKDTPIELSFLKEFRESPASDKLPGEIVTGHDLTMDRNADPTDHEHLLLYSPPKTSKPPSVGSELKKLSGVSAPVEPCQNTTELSPPCRLNTQKKSSIYSQQAPVIDEPPQTSDVEAIPDPLRSIRCSRSFMGDVSLLPSRVRASFKDFEIKPDSMVANESLSTVGLDDSDILKAGLNDMTCPERVPSVCMSMTSNLASPCPNSRMSLASRTALLSSVTQDEVEQMRPRKSFQSELSKNAGFENCKDHYIKHSENYDDDTSVSVPFVFRSVPDKRKSQGKVKFDQSIPVVEFEASQQESHQPMVTSGGCLPDWRTSAGIVGKSTDPLHLISNQEVNEQDTSVSVQFMFNAVPVKTPSDANKLGQSFPVIECGEVQPSALMELTEVTPVCHPVVIESRKSVGRSGAPGRNSIQPSCSSQMELTDAVAGRKSTRLSSNFPDPHESSGIEMDETLMKVKPLMKDKSEMHLDDNVSTGGPFTSRFDMEKTNVISVGVENHRKSLLGPSPLCLEVDETLMKMKPSVKDKSEMHLDDNVSTGGPFTSRFDMEETNVISVGVENNRKSLLGPSSLRLSNEETIARPTSDVAYVVGHRKSCVSISNEDTVVESDIKYVEGSTSCGLTGTLNMEKTTVSSRTRLSIVPYTRKSLFVPTSPKKCDSVDPQIPKPLEEESQKVAKPSVASRHSDVFAGVHEPHPSRPSTRLSSTSFAPDVVCGQPEDQYLNEDEVNVKTSPETVAVEVTNETDGIDRFLNAGLDNPDELKSTCVNRRSNFFSACNETNEPFPPARLSCRKSGFSMFGEAQPGQEYCSDRENVNNPSEKVKNHITSLTESIGNRGVDDKSESIEASPVPPNVWDSEGYLEHEGNQVNKTGLRLSRKSARFINTSDTEESKVCDDLILNPGRMAEIDVEQNDGRAPELVSDGCSEIQLIHDTQGGAEKSCVPVECSGRKSCIDDSCVRSMEINRKDGLKPNSEELFCDSEFAIRRNKRKSVIGTRQSDNYPGIDPVDPEAYEKLDVTPLDGQQYESEMSAMPVSDPAETDAEDKDVELNQDEVNIALEMESLHTTSTPCKSRTSCAVEDPSWDRKRNRSGSAKTPLTDDLAHDLSQEMMNVSIQSDTRSPLPKKTSIRPPRKSTVNDSLAGDLDHDLSQEMMNVSIQSDTRGPLTEELQPPHTSAATDSLSTPAVSLCYAPASHKLSLKATEDLPYETRVENRDLMRRHGFRLLGSQTNWETLLYDDVLGLSVVLPLRKFSEHTEIKSIQYTYYSWRIGQTMFLDRETVEFIRSRIEQNMPRSWLVEECKQIGDLDRIVSSLRNYIETLTPLIKQLDYVKHRHPCTISNDSVSFKVINLKAKAHFEVMLDMRNSHQMSDSRITVLEHKGKLNQDTVGMVFDMLPLSDVNVLLRFVKYLKSETSQFLL